MAGGLLASGALTALFAMALAPPSTSQDVPTTPQPPTDKIRVEVVTVNGSGCPEGTVAVAPAPDDSAFTVTYSHYLASAGEQSDPVDFRKNCQLNLLVHAPEGYTYAIASVDYRGYASLQPGVNGVEKASYYFQGSPETTSESHRWRGPYADNWQATDSKPWEDLDWAPCGAKRNLNVNTELRVLLGSTDRSKTSFMAMDSTDARASSVYHLAWKQC
ncbi:MULTISPECIES: DUF4360 domain-containing protein [Streptomyces]|uniref:DUF4360 domain-containing protein n=1 Tax=Streptomyces lasiicapitis TaxID=1923961 RepID=A0ABQ2M9K9_9ACTN|nr:MULTISPECIES: DUF4360 domain-containing protein [Streptomyces]QIB41767.1 DUF4360 domain-containing protein [Streptomyces aureoverticillatus]GGO48658.1 hypothetical protein GCM10012286_44790 [Streptomyces lasiicapitis]